MLLSLHLSHTHTHSHIHQHTSIQWPLYNCCQRFDLFIFAIKYNLLYMLWESITSRHSGTWQLHLVTPNKQSSFKCPYTVDISLCLCYILSALCFGGLLFQLSQVTVHPMVQWKACLYECALNRMCVLWMWINWLRKMMTTTTTKFCLRVKHEIWQSAHWLLLRCSSQSCLSLWLSPKQLTGVRSLGN